MHSPVASAASRSGKVCSRMISVPSLKAAGPTDTMLIVTIRTRPASRISEFACPRDRVQKWSTICMRQMTAAASLRAAEECSKFYQPNRAKPKKAPECEDELRAPDVFEAIGRRREDA